MRNNFLSANVRRLREEKGLTRAQLELLAGTTTIAMIEGGNRGEQISYKTAVSIAKALGVAPEALFAKPTKQPRKRQLPSDSSKPKHAA